MIVHVLKEWLILVAFVMFVYIKVALWSTCPPPAAASRFITNRFGSDFICAKHNDNTTDRDLICCGLCYHYRLRFHHHTQSIRKGHGECPHRHPKDPKSINTVLRGGGGPWQGRAGQASCAILEYQKDGMKANPNQTGERDC